MDTPLELDATSAFLFLGVLVGTIAMAAIQVLLMMLPLTALAAAVGAMAIGGRLGAWGATMPWAAAGIAARSSQTQQAVRTSPTTRHAVGHERGGAMTPTLQRRIRFTAVDWLVTILIAGLMALEGGQVLGLMSLPFGMGAFLLTTLFILGGTLWLTSNAGAGFRLDAFTVALLALAVFVSIGGTALMLSGITFAGVVVLGYLVVTIAAYTIYRIEGSARRESPAQEPMHEAQAAVGRHSPSVSAVDLAGIDIFRRLDEEQRQAVGFLAERLYVSPEETLAEANNYATRLYGIVHGQVELHAYSPIGELTVRIAGPGESFPLAALVGPGQLVTSARTMGQAEVIAVPVEPLLALCRTDPTIGMVLYEAIAEVLIERYRATLDRLTQGMDIALQRAVVWANV